MPWGQPLRRVNYFSFPEKEFQDYTNTHFLFYSLRALSSGTIMTPRVHWLAWVATSTSSTARPSNTDWDPSQSRGPPTLMKGLSDFKIFVIKLPSLP